MDWGVQVNWDGTGLYFSESSGGSNLMHDNKQVNWLTNNPSKIGSVLTTVKQDISPTGS